MPKYSMWTDMLFCERLTILAEQLHQVSGLDARIIRVLCIVLGEIRRMEGQSGG
jgi:hypothetical protein